jgi:RNA polymerase sigma-70 factor (ECF subfamily)
MNETVMEFHKIHDDFRPRVQRYLARLVGESEAEDLTQEVFLRVNRGLEGFRGESRLSTWIYRIATNAALDRLRSPSFSRVDPIGLLDGGGPEEDLAEPEVDSPEAKGPSVEMQVFQEQRAECYQDFIDRLPLNYRTVVALSELHGLVTDEIADILGLSPNAVKVRLHRGRARLLRELRNYCRAEDWL